MTNDGSELFGPGRTWWGVYEYALSFTTRTWPGMRSEDVADAVGDAVERTMAMWVHWKGSVVPDNPGLTERGAKRHACMHAHKVLKQQLKDRERKVHVPSSGRMDPMTAAASEAIAELQADEREWDRWAKDWLADGLNEREAAERHGVTQQAVSKRRSAGIKRMRPLGSHTHQPQGAAT